MVNQPPQTKTSDTIKINTLADNQLLILNTATYTANNSSNYQEQLQHDLSYNQLDLKNYPHMIYSDMKEGNAFRGFLPHESEFRAETVSTMRVIGEELNTPVITYTKPEFNLYTNSRATQSLKQESTGSMLMLNNNNSIIDNNNSTLNQSSTINAADDWCTDLSDYPSLLFSPDSTKSSNSPSGLNSSDLTEESFIYDTTVCDTNLPVKYSQDYEDCEFIDEINQISKLKEFNTDCNLNLKIEEEDDSHSSYELSNSLEAKTVLYQDTMITGLAPPTMLMDEDSYLVTVDNFNDLFIKPDKNVMMGNVNLDRNSSQEVFQQQFTDYILTPAPSPKSPISNNQNTDDNVDDCENSSDCLNPVNDMYKGSSPAEDRLQLEHNYNLNINPYNNRIDETSSSKRKLVTDRSPARQQEKRTRRVQPLKLKIPIMRTLRQDSVNIDVNTPDITNDILAMEDEKFDLINFIISSQDKNLTEPTVDIIDPTPPTKPQSPLNLEAFMNEQCPIPSKRRRINSYDNPGSVQSITSTIVSDDSSTAPAPKRRGRPPKTECTLPSPTKFKHLSESDWKYLEMRNKNNEASRRSRINRKDREHQIESEARELENEYKILSEEEKALLKQVAKWRNAVMKLAQI